MQEEFKKEMGVMICCILISKHFYTDFTKAWIGFSNSYFYLLGGNVFI